MFLLGRLTVRQLVLSAVLWLSVIFPSAHGQEGAWVCGFGRQARQTLTRRAEQAEVVVQVIWKESHQGAAGDKGVTVYEITRIVKGLEGLLKVGDKLKFPEFRAGAEGETFLLTGTQAPNIEWGTPVKVSGTAFQYAVYLSSHRLSNEQRLLYFLNYLEHEDELIANDAYLELLLAPYQEILKIRESIPTEDVRRWIADQQTAPTTRLGRYGLLLGMSGDSDDAAALLEIINEPTQDFRWGLQELMSGYLLISEAEGLEILETSKLQNKDAPFSETYAALQALRFMWKYAPDRISKNRLRQSMRSMLDRPELADLVIYDLIRWKDWEVVDRLLAMYDDEAFDEPRIKRSIIRYLAVYQQTAEEISGDAPPYTVKASAALERFQKEDPKLYHQAIRFLQFE